LLESFDYDSGEENFDGDVEFLEMSDEKKELHVKKRWHQAWAKARGAVHVLQTFGDLNRRIFLYGSTMKRTTMKSSEDLKGSDM